MTHRPPHILVVTHYFTAHGGGIERVAEQLIREIDTLCEVSFTWAASDTDPAPHIPDTSLLPMHACNVLEQLLGVPWPVWGPGSLKRLKQEIAKADIVWLHDTLYPGNLLAYRWAQKLNKPVVITQHIGPIPYRNKLLRFLMQQADRRLTLPMLRNARQTIFVSDRIAESYNRRIAFKTPVKIIPNGVDLKQFNPAPEETRPLLREQFALRDEQPIFLFVGRFVEKKGLNVIRRLATLLPDCRFWLAGKGPANPTAWHKPNVHVFPNRSGASLAELYHAADLLILPSYGEGFPLVIQEALACGLPVLCSPETAAGSRLAAPHLHQARVWPDNPAVTAAAWAEKLKSFPIRLPLGAPSYGLAHFAATAWPWPSIAEAYIEIFQRLLPKK